MNKRRLTTVAAVAVGAVAGAAVVVAMAAAGSGPPVDSSGRPSAPASSAAGHGHPPGPALSDGPGGTVVVHAADELRATLAQLVPRFEEAFPGVHVVVEYGAGTEHAGHIRSGVGVDVFVSADAVAAGQVDAAHVRGTPAVVARNPIVIAVPSAAGTRIAGVADLPGTRVALCVETTPCGRQGRAALVAAAVDVRPVSVEPDPATALTRVRAGDADAALVYRTDVVAAGAELKALDFSAANGVADEFTAVKATTGANAVGADAFVGFLSSALARHIFADAGLSPV
jgi:molybdate transport system substrate-binding protein